MTITRTITRTDVTSEWALWVEAGEGTHAILLDRTESDEQVWVETDASTASTFAREYGADRVATIVTAPLAIWTVTFEDRQVTGAATTSVDVFAHDLDQAFRDGAAAFRAMGADVTRWQVVRVERRADQSL